MLGPPPPFTPNASASDTPITRAVDHALPAPFAAALAAELAGRTPIFFDPVVVFGMGDVAGSASTEKRPPRSAAADISALGTGIGVMTVEVSRRVFVAVPSPCALWQSSATLVESRTLLAAFRIMSLSCSLRFSLSPSRSRSPSRSPDVGAARRGGITERRGALATSTTHYTPAPPTRVRKDEQILPLCAFYRGFNRVCSVRAIPHGTTPSVAPNALQRIATEKERCVIVVLSPLRAIMLCFCPVGGVQSKGYLGYTFFGLQKILRVPKVTGSRGIKVYKVVPPSFPPRSPQPATIPLDRPPFLSGQTTTQADNPTPLPINS